jgi:hypothetical protein
MIQALLHVFTFIVATVAVLWTLYAFTSGQKNPVAVWLSPLRAAVAWLVERWRDVNGLFAAKRVATFAAFAGEAERFTPLDRAGILLRGAPRVAFGFAIVVAVIQLLVVLPTLKVEVSDATLAALVGLAGLYLGARSIDKANGVS